MVDSKPSIYPNILFWKNISFAFDESLYLRSVLFAKTSLTKNAQLQNSLISDMLTFKYISKWILQTWCQTVRAGLRIFVLSIALLYIITYIEDTGRVDKSCIRT